MLGVEVIASGDMCHVSRQGFGQKFIYCNVNLLTAIALESRTAFAKVEPRVGILTT
jgi:hypothetical protein